MLDVFTDKAGEYRWHVQADNNRTTADCGEGYVDEVDCIHGAGVTLEELLEHHPDAERYVDAWLAKRGETRSHRWVSA